MTKRAIRLAICGVLLAAAGVAAQMLVAIDRRADAAVAAGAAVDLRLERISDSLQAIALAQQNYVVPGQSDTPWFEQMSGRLRQYYDDAAALTPLVRSIARATALQRLSEGSDALVAADTRARENLRLGQDASAADVIATDARPAIDGMLDTVRQLRAAERAAADAEIRGASGERWQVAGSAAVLWTVGLLLLALVPAGGKQAEAATALTPAEVTAPTPAAPVEHWLKPIDLAAAADVCVDLSRMASTAALAPLLSRAATALDASGLIVWMNAGEELFAVTAHGYQPQIVAKLGPISRHALNATAQAWREGRITIVPSEGTDPGAVVAPMFGPDACIGVLSVELRLGREGDATVQAVAAMIAAQLATAVTAWPAASPAPVISHQPARELRSAGSGGI